MVGGPDLAHRLPTKNIMGTDHFDTVCSRIQTPLSSRIITLLLAFFSTISKQRELCMANSGFGDVFEVQTLVF